jgi:hypothetical protein
MRPLPSCTAIDPAKSVCNRIAADLVFLVAAMARVNVCIAVQAVEIAFFFAMVGVSIAEIGTVAISQGCTSLTEVGFSISIGVGAIVLAPATVMRGLLAVRCEFEVKDKVTRD